MGAGGVESFQRPPAPCRHYTYIVSVSAGGGWCFPLVLVFLFFVDLRVAGVEVLKAGGTDGDMAGRWECLRR